MLHLLNNIFFLSNFLPIEFSSLNPRGFSLVKNILTTDFSPSDFLPADFMPFYFLTFDFLLQDFSYLYSRATYFCA